VSILLPPFNPGATCPKCLHDVVTSKWRLDARHSTSGHPAPAPEWIVRRCARCEFMWDEACLDAMGPAETGREGE
jgi:hypothetical protein